MIFDNLGREPLGRGIPEFSLEYIRECCPAQARRRASPGYRLHQGGASWLEQIAATGCDCVGLDWSIDLGDARRRIGERAALQGNLDPSVLLASPEAVARSPEGARLVRQRSRPRLQSGPRRPAVQPPENVAALVAAVHELSPKFHDRGGNRGSCGRVATNDLLQTLPQSLWRGVSAPPGEVLQVLLTSQSIDRADFEQPEEFLAEV